MISDNSATNSSINRKKVLVVDDSALMRRVVCDIIQKDGKYVVEDVCSDGLQAYNLLVRKSYDAAIIDIHMPKMSGLDLLKRCKDEKIGIRAVVAASMTKDGASETIQAMSLGAVDFLSKPNNFIEARGSDYEKALLEALKLAVSVAPAGRPPLAAATEKPAPEIPAPEARTPVTERPRPTAGTAQAPSPKGGIPVTSGGKALTAAMEEVKAKAAEARAAAAESLGRATASAPTASVPERTITPLPSTPKQAVPVTLERGKLRTNKHYGASAQIKLVAIACSTGGPKALKSVIPFLPANLDAPVVIVQHMPKDFTYMMAQKLDAASPLRVKEAEDGEIIRKGTVYVAPGGYHLNLDHHGTEEKIRLSDEPIREGVKPCANYMYESLRASIYDEITCVVLTGMGADGTAGIRALAENNNTMYTISQNEQTCVVYGMPKAVYEAGLVNEVVPLTEIANAIVKNVGVK
ncbi:MAG: chemotaxis-specific protein-glutamate methyltransferase CheB [Lachnospiraceae bacterium]|nr:chemotaxis-specific protein-glutamate methyltransferase CheB [Lachnospiraceae bacterium]